MPTLNRRVRKGKRVLLVTVKRFAVLGSKQKAGTRLAGGAAVDVIVQGRKPRAKGAAKAKPGAAHGKTKAPAKKEPAVRRPGKPKPPVYQPDLPAP